MTNQSSIKNLEANLWASADVLRAKTNLNASQYCMFVLGLLFLKYSYGRYKKVEAELMKNIPSCGVVVYPVTKTDFDSKSAFSLPREAPYDYLLNLIENIATADIRDRQERLLSSLGDVVNYAMMLIEEQSEHLTDQLPNTYTLFSDEILVRLLRIFNNDKLDEFCGDVIGRINECFTGKFSKTIANDDGVFFTPQSLDHEEERFVSEGFADDEQLSIYDLLFKEIISKSDIAKLKKISVELLEAVKHRIAELHNWRKKITTTAMIGKLIHDTLYAELPESYGIDEIKPYSQKLYHYIYERYPFVAA